MESSITAAETSAETAVNFVRDDTLVPEPKEKIQTTDEHRRAPRNPGSRRITFIDDGKLFEGHFTIRSTNLKSIIQYLLDRHNEQDVIIQDLQKQLHTLRSRSRKASRRGGDGEFGGGVAHKATGALFGAVDVPSDINARLKKVEQFLQLWGVQLNDVAELVEEYGDPTITPDSYTSYLLDLPAFRLIRREARALLLNASQQVAVNASTAAASDTASRRRTSSARRDAAGPSSAGSSHEEEKKSESPEKRNAAESTLEKATAALEKAEMLLAELHTAVTQGPTPPPPPPRPRRAKASARPATVTSSSSGVAVDVEARADLEELGDYVMQRFEELERRTAMMMARAAAASSSAAHNDRNASRQAGENIKEKESTGKKNAKAAPAHSPPPPPPLPRATTTTTSSSRGTEEFVDAVAREDAAASLDLLESLEAAMERRFKDLNNAVANIAARTAVLAKNSINSGGDADKLQSRNASTATSGKNTTQSSVEGKRKSKDQQSAAVEDSAAGGDGRGSLANSRSSSSAAKKNETKTPDLKEREDSNDFNELIPESSVMIPAIMVDQTARDDTLALSERVSDLEEELLDRWQAMEERLRIIGRVAMKQGIINSSGNGAGTQSMGRTPAVDRKAREDAALSLMRLQQIEKELAQLKRQFASGTTTNNNSSAVLEEGAKRASLPVILSPSAPSAPLRDTYGSKVSELEREVEQRMAEVNQAIAQLRGVGGSATPLTLSPYKGDKERVEMALVQSAGTAPQSSLVGAAAAPSTAGQLTLCAEEADTAAKTPVTILPTSPNQSEDRRRAILQSVLELGYDVEGDTNLSDFSRMSLQVGGGGGRRTTISRLRSPDVPPFGSHLVLREVVDIPLVGTTQLAGDDIALGVSEEREAVAVAAAPAQPARRISDVNGGFVHADGETHFTTSPRSSKVRAVDTTRVSVS